MSQPARLPLWFLFANWLIVLGAFLLGAKLAHRNSLPDPQAIALDAVFKTVQESYVDEVDPHELADRAIAAMARLDDYSVYVPAKDLPRFVEETTGTYEGIGMEPRFLDDGVFVHVPFDQGPADKAGLEPGDEIVAIDGTRIDSLSPEQRRSLTVDRLRGPAGTHVSLTIDRPGTGERTIDVERAAVQERSVKWAQLLDAEHGLGYVHLAEFHPGVAAAIGRALDELAATPHGLRGLVFDLRFDGGGQLDECLDIARLFLRSGNIVTLRRRGEEVLQRHDADPDKCRFPDLPLVLLVNAHSASASEVLAGALQDHERAAIVGTATYGKGYVNTIFQWRDQDFRLKLTTASYFTPNGRNLDRGRHRRDAEHGDGGQAGTEPPGGITPDHVVELDPRQLGAVRSALAGHEVPPQHRRALAAWSRARGLLQPGIIGPGDDPQLAAAIEVLRQRVAAGAATNGK